jgi:dihydroorotate dehydrogenase electron transfer subunit
MASRYLKVFFDMEIQNSNLSRAKLREFKTQTFGIVTSNRRIGKNFYKLKLEFSGSAAEAFKKFKPGQFAQLDLSTTALPSPSNIPEDLADASTRQIILRRPFSFTDISVYKDKTTAELLYCVVGPATLRMTSISAGNSLNVIGPLGNGFAIPDGKKTALLVAGGMGTPPLQHLAKVLASDYTNIEALVFAGAKTAKELPFENILDQISQQLGFSLPEFARHGIKSQLATDDGTAGFAGFVTDCVSQWLDEQKPAHESTIIYGCGPEAMLARLAEIANKKYIDCQISMERHMACGFGVCQSCAVECRVKGSSETEYKLCCKDGPVFNAQDVIFKK